MPNTVVFRHPFRKRGQAWLPPSRAITLIGDVTGSGGIILGGSAPTAYAMVPAGGVQVAGSADVLFRHTGQVAADIVVEWDFDNDGDFSESVEDITPYALSLETFTGRDWPSLLTGKAGPGKFRASLRNDDDRFSYFNTSSPLNTSPRSLKTGRKVRVRIAGAANPDPTLLVRDRFRRADGALEADDTGKFYSEPLTTNKVQNPGFETNTTGWTAQGGSTITRVTSIAHSGTACLEVKRASANPPFNLYGPTCTGVDSGAITGDTVVISAWVYIPAASFPKVTLIVFGAAGVDYALANTDSLVADTWTQVSRVVTLTDTLDDIDIQFWTDDSHANGDVVAYVDDVTATVTSWAVTSSRAVATEEGGTHLAVVDTGSADYYIQARVSVLGASSNRVGLVYRYVDSNDYSVCVLNAGLGLVELSDVVAGVETSVANRPVEVYSGATVGVLVEGTSVTAYMEGVPFFVGLAGNTSAGSAGIYAEWGAADDRPEIDDFYVWDGLPAQVDGVLWTGDVSELAASVTAGTEKLASVSGEGRLSKLATQRITPPASLAGRKTGLLVGNVLSESMLLHPPGQIDEGDITTGVFAIEETTAMEVARRVEETEFGFLHETQEGYISYDSRSAREDAASAATFTDATDGKYGYHRLEPYDWRREVFNRVIAGVSPWAEGVEATLFTDPGPYALSAGDTQMLQASYDGTVVRWTGHTRDVEGPGFPVVASVDGQATTGTATADFDVDMPATVNSGDLLLVAISNREDGFLTGVGANAAGWTDLSNSSIFAKVATGSEGGTTVTFLGVALNGFWAVQVFRITNWYGSLAGVQLASSAFTKQVNDQPDPPPLSPSWGALPTLYIAIFQSRDTAGSALSLMETPTGYSDAFYTHDSGAYLGSAQREVSGTASENPGPFELSPAAYSQVARTVAIRGGGGISTTQVTGATPTGSNPSFTIEYVASLGGTTQSHQNIEVSGVPLIQGDQQLIQADDFESQDEHNAIRTYTNPANLFASASDALAYANLVLETHADDRPIFSLSFYATKSKAYRKQACTRRVGDRITLTAINNAGMGISRDFFIESISHKFSHGNRLWEVIWELSPA
ncbi:carbohydrate binding domain-containing protein [Nonomuraea sp. NPDC050404]|uniref:carbohydrate binding domain-containing protein n=1 Tax=Nonomuraea sp. NPDC050404 TaxID=3155783 RepID=UPI0033E76754